MAKARINLSGIDIGQINEICTNITDIAKSTKTKISGPIPLPTQILKHTTRKSPCGDGKATWDNFEMRIHKRLIDLADNERALRLVMRVPIPKDVDIEIELFD
ncbi:30S ribosomal protein S10 [Candidatus Woesearchaeota archaeon]|jgi:ribosomal protein uS10|nr:30S ribosomal protein S10 [Candidatus Woesearchaeota archaeon]MBT4058540.1 30S ribosomal protein S10 [Candidatus Woesearchaeota archaeon]MBT4208971.1 30S ribosomal protein S10 [Candidatus Woesearchaeota archaeon]MBT4783485.1 30S ribosomal protein S10 [Candidatus Woesearchaeota archaeon]MBT5042964.1 30S ribosomal protein S10 [Candidatus Woesearchaeota archaeon]